jgi:hypothetical protein
MDSYCKSNELVICVRLMLTSLLSTRWHYDSLIKKDTNNVEFDDRLDSYVRCNKSILLGKSMLSLRHGEGLMMCCTL